MKKNTPDLAVWYVLHRAPLIVLIIALAMLPPLHILTYPLLLFDPIYQPIMRWLDRVTRLCNFQCRGSYCRCGMGALCVCVFFVFFLSRLVCLFFYPIVSDVFFLETAYCWPGHKTNKKIRDLMFQNLHIMKTYGICGPWNHWILIFWTDITACVWRIVFSFWFLDKF